ncbi:MAG: dynamin family protein [Ardenticatenaceae bacterium]|nr:dynamin family protein [Ardenticatenaceae bacterium]
MNNLSDLQEKFDNLVEETCETLKYLHQLSLAFSLMSPNPPSLFEDWISILRQTKVTLMVVGRAKRGKSSFVNGLIGRELLPVDLDIATSQAFVVRKAEEESYLANLVDGSSVPIGLEDLYLIGSELGQDSRNEDSQINKIRWIDINVRSEYLPENQNIVDTPGLSSLYSRHSVITLDFLPIADIIIFVLDSERPILQEEIIFLHFLLDNDYQDIFFIQTKIDDGGWEEIKARNEEKLQEEFKGRLFSFKVWPVSNTSLLLGRKTKNEKIIQHSLFDTLNTKLQAFIIYRTTWQQLFDSLKDGYKFYISRRGTLVDQLNSLEKPSKDNPSLEQAKIDKDEFYRKWVTPGTALNEAKADISKEIDHNKEYFRDVIKTGGSLEREFARNIDEAKTIDELITLSQSLSDEVKNAALIHWEKISRDTRKKCMEILHNADELLEDVVLPSKEISYKNFELTQKKLSEDTSFKETIILGGVAAGLGTASYLLNSGGRANNLSKLVRSLLYAAKLGVGIAAVASHLKAREEMNLKKAINECHSNLRKLIYEVYSFFQDRQPENDSIANSFFSELRESSYAEIDKLVLERRTYLDVRYSTLVEGVNASNAVKQKAIQKLKSQLEQWDSSGKKIQSLQVDVNSVRKDIDN